MTHSIFQIWRSAWYLSFLDSEQFPIVFTKENASSGIRFWNIQDPHDICISWIPNNFPLDLLRKTSAWASKFEISRIHISSAFFGFRTISHWIYYRKCQLGHQVLKYQGSAWYLHFLTSEQFPIEFTKENVSLSIRFWNVKDPHDICISWIPDNFHWIYYRKY